MLLATSITRIRPTSALPHMGPYFDNACNLGCYPTHEEAYTDFCSVVGELLYKRQKAIFLWSGALPDLGPHKAPPRTGPYSSKAHSLRLYIAPNMNRMLSQSWDCRSFNWPCLGSKPCSVDLSIHEHQFYNTRSIFHILHIQMVDRGFMTNCKSSSKQRMWSDGTSSS
jgi:hypothetical protein